MTVPVVLAIAGVIALFLSVWGGGIKAKEIEIPPAPSNARSIIGILGLVFIGISIWLSTASTITLSGMASTEIPIPTSTLTTISLTSTIAPSPVEERDTQAIVSRSKVDEWSFGQTKLDNVAFCLGEFDKVIAPYTSFKEDDLIPRGVLLTANFWIDNGVHWNQLPVKPICVYNDWGLFESVDEFQSVGIGKYRQIIP